MFVPDPHQFTEHVEFVNVAGPYDAVKKTGVETSVFADAWAYIRDLGGTLDVSDQQHQTQTKEYEIWVRYIEGLTGLVQMKWDARMLVITPPQKITDERGRLWWTFNAQEVVVQQVS